MKRKAKIDWRSYTVADVCPSCIFFNWCAMYEDCQAMKILVKIREDMDCGNTDP